MIFGIKTRKDLKSEIISLEDKLYKSNTKLMAVTDIKEQQAGKINFYEDLFNQNIFENVAVNTPEGAALLSLEEYTFANKTETTDSTEVVEVVENSQEEENENTPVKYNATLYCDSEAPYMYLSKKLTDGYKFLAVNFVQGRIRFYLNNDNIGMEIDSNNRVRNKLILKFLQDYFGFIDGKISIFFEKIQIF